MRLIILLVFSCCTFIPRTLTKFEKCQGGALQFEPGEAGAEEAKLKKFSDAGGSQIQWLPDAGRFKLCERSRYSQDIFFEEFTPTTEAASGQVVHKLFRSAAYLGTGAVFSSCAKLSGLIGTTIHWVGPTSTSAELLMFSKLSATVAKRSFAQAWDEWSLPHLPAHSSWHLNRNLLSQVPILNTQDEKLLQFLRDRWQAKMAGFSSFAVAWTYPCFKSDVQVNPNTNHTYARLLTSGLPEVYKHKMIHWKQSLPQPRDFSLFLTRPGDLREYLPIHVELSQYDMIFPMIEQLALTKTDLYSMIDVSPLFAEPVESWPSIWKKCCDLLTVACGKYKVDPKQILCIHRLRENAIGGIRLLHLAAQNKEDVEKQDLFLLDWISCFGLVVNRVELDRYIIPLDGAMGVSTQEDRDTESILTKTDVLSYLNIPQCEEQWKTGPLHKTLMVQGALQILQGLFEHITEDQWSTITHCPTRFRILQISIFKIKKQLDLLTNQITFSEMTSHLEQIYANFSALLEIFAPFKPGDFPLIYANRLSIPPNLKPFLTCSLHSSAMLSLAGVFKAFQKNLRRKPHVLYGENMYFECVHSVGKAAHAICVKEATEEHWKEVDLLLMQFNPSLIATMHAGYKSEQIEDVLRTCLRAKQGAPVTLALDCTFDLIDSPRVNTLLHKFQHEIKSGSLNIICYRSGNKFDLFGMDNYCGAPFIMINNREPQWDMFHSLLTDEVLQPDALTYRWFCLAYQCAAPQLELYRTQIFNNTRALLNKIPARLLRDATAHYRVLPMEEEMQPFFIDIKVLGFGHSLRGPSLVAGELCVRGMEEGHPILSRLSLGFYHPNLTVIFDEENCTIRLTLGLDPAQVDVFAKSFQRIDALNGRI